MKYERAFKSFSHAKIVMMAYENFIDCLTKKVFSAFSMRRE